MEKLNVDIVALDLDGTLIDSCGDIADSLNETFALLGYPPLSMGVIKDFVGYGVAPLIHQAVVEAGHPDKEKDVLGKFKETYFRKLLDTTKPYDGVVDTLHSLKEKFTLALVTNKSEGFTRKIMAGLSFEKFFDDRVYGGDTLTVKKPDPSALKEIAKKEGVELSRVVMVGDSDVDIHTGKNAEAKTVGVSYGYRSVKELEDAGADIIINSFGELAEVLR